MPARLTKLNTASLRYLLLRLTKERRGSARVHSGLGAGLGSKVTAFHSVVYSTETYYGLRQVYL